MLASRFSLIYEDIISNLILINPIGLENYLEYVEYKDISFFYKKELKLQPENIINYQKKIITMALYWKLLAKISAKTYDMIFNRSVLKEFKKFNTPVSLILGIRDPKGPGKNWKKTGINYDLGRYDLLGKRFKKMNSNINLIELDGLGHVPQIEDFELFYSELEKVLQN